MRELIQPSTDLYEAFRDCHEEWGPGSHEDGFGIDEHDNLDTREGFETWVARMLNQVHPAGTRCPDRPHWSPRWVIEDGRIVAGFALRHLHDEQFGRVGYGVRPSARRQGVASWALTETLAECRDVLGLDRALMTCLADNIPSARTIEHCGGVLEGIAEFGTHRVRRYWVNLAS